MKRLQFTAFILLSIAVREQVNCASIEEPTEMVARERRSCGCGCKGGGQPVAAFSQPGSNCCDGRCQSEGWTNGNGCCINACCMTKMVDIKLFQACTRHYYRSENKTTWLYARDFCSRKGMDMVCVENMCNAEYVDLVTSLPIVSGGVWLCYNDMGMRRVFKTTSGQLMGHRTAWAPGEPNDLPPPVSCVSLQVEDQLWKVENCSALNYFLCVVPDRCYAPCQC